MHPNARGIAVKKAYIDAGAERAAYQMTEVDVYNQPVGQPQVAKVSTHEEVSQFDFFEQCALTQLEAGRLATRFNTKLSALGIKVPYIKFLEPTCYSWLTDGTDDAAVLSEKRLDVSKYKKWNDNKGGVDTLLAKVQPLLELGLGTIGEEEEEEEEEEEADQEEEEQVQVVDEESRQQIIDDDVPQAFSHWSYHDTGGNKRRFLVCDLQGVLNSSFELTDPAIHSRRKRFGVTDHGQRGHEAFFATHKCNPLCKILQLKSPSFKPEGPASQGQA